MASIDLHAGRGGRSGAVRLDAEPAETIDLAALRRYRLGRVRAQMRARDIPALILTDAVNIRYATGTRNMQVFTTRNAPARYLLLTDSDAVLFEFTGCMHLAHGIETITELRPALTASFVAAGEGIGERERAWAAEMADALREKVGAGARVGIERVNAGAALALAAEGFELVDAQAPVERARAIKSPEELQCIRASIAATEVAVARLRAALRPGLTEVALWSVLHQAIIERDADYVETRLLSSGPRTNPWFQEAGTRVIGENELVALDTDVVGCYGYYADLSRTFHSGPGAPSRAQRDLYRIARDQVEHNTGILRAGMGFRDYAEAAWAIPERYHRNRYYLSAHGCGMTGEYPYLYHHADFPDAGYDGVIEAGMTLCVESFIGEAAGGEGVKLEQQVLITDAGAVVLSRFPLEDELLG